MQNHKLTIAYYLQLLGSVPAIPSLGMFQQVTGALKSVEPNDPNQFGDASVNEGCRHGNQGKIQSQAHIQWSSSQGKGIITIWTLTCLRPGQTGQTSHFHHQNWKCLTGEKVFDCWNGKCMSSIQKHLCLVGTNEDWEWGHGCIPPKSSFGNNASMSLQCLSSLLLQRSKNPRYKHK